MISINLFCRSWNWKIFFVSKLWCTKMSENHFERSLDILQPSVDKKGGNDLQKTNWMVDTWFQVIISPDISNFQPATDFWCTEISLICTTPELENLRTRTRNRNKCNSRTLNRTKFRNRIVKLRATGTNNRPSPVLEFLQVIILSRYMIRPLSYALKCQNPDMGTHFGEFRQYKFFSWFLTHICRCASSRAYRNANSSVVQLIESSIPVSELLTRKPGWGIALFSDWSIPWRDGSDSTKNLRVGSDYFMISYIRKTVEIIMPNLAVRASKKRCNTFFWYRKSCRKSTKKFFFDLIYHENWKKLTQVIMKVGSNWTKRALLVGNSQIKPEISDFGGIFTSVVSTREP